MRRLVGRTPGRVIPHFLPAFEWDGARRQSNLRRHGLDFRDATRVFAGLTFTHEDDRFAYAERRFVTLGCLGDAVVSIVHTETPALIRVISFPRATRREEAIFRNVLPE
jgi:uncharacterized DUF497 family protein